MLDDYTTYGSRVYTAEERQPKTIRVVQTPEPGRKPERVRYSDSHFSGFLGQRAVDGLDSDEADLYDEPA